MTRNIKLEDIPTLGDETVFPDANVLIYRYWPNVNPNKVEEDYRLNFKQLQQQKIRLVGTMAVIDEAANRVYKEQWQKWREKQFKLGGHPTAKYKKFRNSPTGQAMLERIYKVVRNKILEHVELVDKKFTKAQAKALFVVNNMDLPDKVIATVCKENSYIVFTHDSDFRYC
jgi:predicted nucleic acid-binding protein